MLSCPEEPLPKLQFTFYLMGQNHLPYWTVMRTRTGLSSYKSDSFNINAEGPSEVWLKGRF